MNEEKLPEKLPLGSTIAEIATLGDIFTKSGLFPDVTSQAQAVVKILAGREMGFPPIYSMRKVYIIHGQTVVAAEAMGNMIKRSGQYDYHIEKLDSQECILQLTDGGKDVYCSRYTIEDARLAGIVKADSGWIKFPRAMLFARALSQGARIVCPHIIMGTYTPEDFGYTINEEQLEPIEGEATKVEAAIPVIPTEQAKKLPAHGPIAANAIKYLWTVANNAGKVGPSAAEFEDWCIAEFGKSSSDLSYAEINSKIKELKEGQI